MFLLRACVLPSRLGARRVSSQSRKNVYCLVFFSTNIHPARTWCTKRDMLAFLDNFRNPDSPWTIWITLLLPAVAISSQVLGIIRGVGLGYFFFLQYLLYFVNESLF